MGNLFELGKSPKLFTYRRMILVDGPELYALLLVIFLGLRRPLSVCDIVVYKVEVTILRIALIFSFVFFCLLK